MSIAIHSHFSCAYCRIVPGGALIAGPPCSIFVNACVSLHKRSRGRPEGDQRVYLVRLSNLIWRNFVFWHVLANILRLAMPSGLQWYVSSSKLGWVPDSVHVMSHHVTIIMPVGSCCTVQNYLRRHWFRFFWRSSVNCSFGWSNPLNLGRSNAPGWYPSFLLHPCLQTDLVHRSSVYFCITVSYYILLYITVFHCISMYFILFQCISY